jgi:putative transposase
MPITLKMVLKAVSEDSILSGIHRVVYIEPVQDEVVLIPIQADLQGWFHGVSFKALKNELEPDNPSQAPKVVEIDPKSKDINPPLQGLSDEEITKLYPPKKKSRGDDKKNDHCHGDSIASKEDPDETGHATPSRDADLSPAIAVREYRRSLVHPLLYHADNTKRSRDELFAPGFMAQAIKQRLDEIGQSKRSYLYQCIRLYFIFGEVENALLGDYPDCGAKGESREPKLPNTKLGRWNALYKEGRTTHKGFSLAGNEQEQERIQAFCAGKSAPDGPVSTWYDEYLGVFHHTSIKLVDGDEIIELKPIEEMPTEDEFRDCIKTSKIVGAPWIKRLTAQEYEQKYLPQFGGAADGISRFGQMATLDLTSTDVNLTTIESKLKSAGIASRIPTVDILTGWTYGVHDFYGKHNEENAFLALYNAFTSRNWLGERLGLSFLNDDNFPIYVPDGIFVDHDELFTEDGKLKAGHAGLNLVFPEPCRGNKKPTIESDHRNNHADTGHRMTGTTKGRQRKKGEPDPRDEACWDILGMMRADWRHRYMRNCVEEVPPHLITQEMRLDKVHLEPTRIKVVKWLVDNGYSKCSVADPAKLAAFCLPKIRARAKPNGIFLLRPDCGDGDAFVKYVKYEFPMHCYRQWFGGPSQKGVDIFVGYHPYDLNAIHFAHPQFGVLQFAARWDDPALRNISMPDLLKIQDDALLVRLLRRPITQGARTNFTMSMKAEDANAKAQKRAEMDSQSEPPTKKSMKQHVCENQTAEQDRLQKEFMPPGLKPKSETEPNTPAAQNAGEPVPTPGSQRNFAGPPRPSLNPMRARLKAILLRGKGSEGPTP